MASGIESRFGNTPNESVKAPVVAATTVNITLSGEQTIDGVVVTSGDRVLVKDQTDASENGIYVVSASTWTRATDWNADGDVVAGTLITNTADGVLYGTAFTGPFNIDGTYVSFINVFASGVEEATAAAEAAAAAAEAAAAAAEQSETTILANLPDAIDLMPIISEREDSYLINHVASSWFSMNTDLDLTNGLYISQDGMKAFVMQLPTDPVNGDQSIHELTFAIAFDITTLSLTKTWTGNKDYSLHLEKPLTVTPDGSELWWYNPGPDGSTFGSIQRYFLDNPWDLTGVGSTLTHSQSVDQAPDGKALVVPIVSATTNWGLSNPDHHHKISFDPSGRHFFMVDTDIHPYGSNPYLVKATFMQPWKMDTLVRSSFEETTSEIFPTTISLDSLSCVEFIMDASGYYAFTTRTPDPNDADWDGSIMSQSFNCHYFNKPFELDSSDGWDGSFPNKGWYQQSALGTNDANSDTVCTGIWVNGASSKIFAVQQDMSVATGHRFRIVQWSTSDTSS